MRRVWYRWFRSVSSLQHRLGRRLTPAGRLALAAFGAAAVVGLDTNRTLGSQVFALLGALLVLATAASATFRARLSARRVLPRFATAGQPVTYRVVLTNETDARQEGLVLLDDLADPRPSFEEFTRAREPGEERRNWFDRTVGYPRWMWLVARNRGAVIPRRPVPPLPPRDEVEVRVEVTPMRRGRLRFAAVTIARPDPLGLVQALRRLPLPQSLVVLPRRYPVPDIGLPGTRKYQPGGVALASSVGDSEEFVALRDYRPGDPLRRIHWKSWARVGKPVVKEYLDEFLRTRRGTPSPPACRRAPSSSSGCAGAGRPGGSRAARRTPPSRRPTTRARRRPAGTCGCPAARCRAPDSAAAARRATAAAAAAGAPARGRAGRGARSSPQRTGAARGASA